jgi:hypothetical protein
MTRGRGMSCIAPDIIVLDVRDYSFMKYILGRDDYYFHLIVCDAVGRVVKMAKLSSSLNLVDCGNGRVMYVAESKAPANVEEMLELLARHCRS